jgi:hypothetical protein
MKDQEHYYSFENKKNKKQKNKNKKFHDEKLLRKEKIEYKKHKQKHQYKDLDYQWSEWESTDED